MSSFQRYQYKRYSTFHLRTTLIVFGSILGFILCILLLLTFSRAKIDLVAREEFIPIDSNITAYANILDGPFVFDIIALEDQVSQPLTAIETKKMESFATGKVQLKNSGSTPIELLPSTRLSSEGGLLFYIQSEAPLTIPPYIEGSDPYIVDVKAELPGSVYNIPQGLFTVPGLVGEPEYRLILGNSVEPFEGGGIEDVPVIPESSKAEFISSLTINLHEKLKNRVYQEKTERFMAYSDLMNFTEYEPIIHETGEGNIEVTLRGSVMAVLIERERFAKYLVTDILNKDVYTTVSLLNPENLVFSVGGSTLEDLATAQSLSLSIQGEAHIRYGIQQEEFKKLIAGLPKNSVQEIADRKNEIEDISVSVRPFFRYTIPRSEKRIIINQINM